MTTAVSPTDPRNVPAELRERYDVRGPRYTSYPPATHFAPLDVAALSQGWAARNGRDADRGLSLYFHVPFCQSRCLFCGCHTELFDSGEAPSAYSALLIREMDLAAAVIDPSRPVAQISLGGGTPHSLSPASLHLLLSAMEQRWSVAPRCERSIEVDPRSIGEDHLQVLLDHRFDRFSLGVQDLDERVLTLVARRQSGMAVEETVSRLRAGGVHEINFDLIYGLPGQSVATARDTATRVVELRPSRIATYGYAHVPWIKPHQKVLEDRGLPTAAERLEIYLTWNDLFLAAGYVPVGMDHYALAEDPLAAALADRTLRRGFMGYTTGSGLDVVGFGASAISSVGATYSQNLKDLDRYGAAVDGGQLPMERGYLLSREDELRRELIMTLFCTFEVDLSSLGRQFDLDARALVAEDLEALAPLVDDGLVEVRGGEVVSVTDAGRFFVRNVCMVFDRFLETDRSQRMYSRTV